VLQREYSGLSNDEAILKAQPYIDEALSRGLAEAYRLVPRRDQAALRGVA